MDGFNKSDSSPIPIEQALGVTGGIAKIEISIGPQTFSPIQYTSYTVGGIEMELDLTIRNPETGTVVQISPEAAYDLAIKQVKPLLDKQFQFARRLYWERLQEAGRK